MTTSALRTQPYTAAPSAGQSEWYLDTHLFTWLATAEQTGGRLSVLDAAFAAGDVPAIIASLTDDVVLSAPKTPPHGGRFTGRDGAPELFQGVGAAWEDVHLDIESISDAGDGQVVAIVAASGTRRGGGEFSYGAVSVVTLRDGKIARFREYVDVDAPV